MMMMMMMMTMMMMMMICAHEVGIHKISWHFFDHFLIKEAARVQIEQGLNKQDALALVVTRWAV